MRILLITLSLLVIIIVSKNNNNNNWDKNIQFYARKEDKIPQISLVLHFNQEVKMIED